MPVNPYDVYIDGKGYIVKEGTYASGKQQLAADQFRTGDISYENLTEQQAWAQSDWRGGLDFRNTNENTRFYSNGTLTEPLRSFGGFRMANTLSSTGTFNLTQNGVKEFYKGNWFTFSNSSLYYTNDGATWNSAANLSSSGFTDILAWDENLYAVNPTTKTLWSSSNPTSVGSWVNEVSTSFGVTFTKMEGLKDSIYLTNGGERLYKYDGTGPTGMLIVIDSNEWDILNLAEYNGRMYMGCRSRGNTNRYALRAYDGSTDWTLEQWENLPNGSGSFGVMVPFAGKLYFTVNGKNNTSIVYSFDGQSIIVEYEEFDETSNSTAANPSYIDYAVSNDALWLMKTSDKLSYTNSGVFGTLASLSNVATEGSYWWYKPSSNGSFGLNYGMLFTVNSAIAMVSQSSVLREINNYYTSGTMLSVDIDMDLFSINKMASALEVYHSGLAQNNSLSAILYSYSNSAGHLGNAQSAMVVNTSVGSTKTILRPTAQKGVGRKFTYGVVMSAFGAGSATTPLVNDVVLRWVLEPEDKTQVTFDVMAVDNLQLNDGSYETRTGAQIAADLKAARKKAIVSFTDLDGTVYDPTTTDTDNRGMIIKDAMYKSQFDQANSAEFVVSVNMVQA